MKIYFTKNNGPIEGIIEKLMETAKGIRRPEYVREMIIASLKAGQEDDESSDLKLMNTTLKEMRFTSKVFGSYRMFARSRLRLRPHPGGRSGVRDGKALREKKLRLRLVIWSSQAEAVHYGKPSTKEAGPEHFFRCDIRLPFERSQIPYRA